MRIAIGISNLSTREDTVRRSGIQEVAFQALGALARWDSQTTGIELVPIFRIPDGNPGAAYDYRLTHINPGPLVLEKSLQELGIALSAALERWPHLRPLLEPKKFDVVQRDASALEAILSADAYFETSLTDTRNATRWLKRLKPELVVGHLVHDIGPIIFPEYVAEGMNAWFSHQYLECLRGCDFLVSVSRHTALDVENLLPRKPFQFYVSNPVAPDPGQSFNDNADLHTSLGLPPQARYVLSVATLEPRKNLEHTIRSFLRFRELFGAQFNDVHCVLIGASGWKNEKLLEILSKTENQIIRPGFVSTETLSAAFKNAAAVLLPSHYEGFGIPLAEARACGVPAITCVNSSLPEAAVLDAIFVSPSEPDELASAIARILRNQTASKNQTAFNANMTWDDTLANWVCAAKEVLETRKNTASVKPTSRIQKLNARRNTLTVQLDCHNITINRSKLHKTGIQEVSARLFAAIPEANKELGHLVRFEPLPVCIPHYKIRGTVPTLTPSVHHWQELCEELRIDLNSLGANFRQILSGDSVALASTLQHSDWLFLTSQVTSKLIPGLPNARAAGLKLGYLVHDIIPSVLPQFAPPHLISWFNEAYVESLKEADLIVGNSRHTALDVAQHLGDLNSTNVHWARFPTHQSLSETGLPSEPPPADLRAKPYFVLLGSTDPRKNVFNALKAMERFLLDDSLQTKPILVMVGASGWNNDGLNTLLNTLERQALVKRMGYVSDAKLANLLAHCQALLMPSRYEGFGMPIAQANAQGIPVLTCNNSSLPEVALDGRPSFVYPEHADELYFAMRRVMMTESKKEVGEKETSWVELLVRIGHILEQHSN